MGRGGGGGRVGRGGEGVDEGDGGGSGERGVVTPTRSKRAGKFERKFYVPGHSEGDVINAWSFSR